MRVSHCLTAIAALAVIGSAVPAQAKERLTGEAKLAKMLEGRVAGKPVDCLSLTQIRSSEIIDRTAIVYTTSDGTIYVNRPSGANFLDDDDILVSEPRGGQTCRIDIVRLIDRGTRMAGASVGLNDFVPYPRPPKVKN
ncbi:hypothetical protein PX554_14475 [Sphingomonas sp. H39-1-10]|uniref:hypothetical protein n=1 Tax=Sphingomonas TaxID=13687 RepID=UPI000892297C|nr:MULTISPECIES: hypothetical protein [Sphingomonas]MDF0489339.1 hypothetical protein [Sphingomonas pollutisoli]SDA29979.1 hypothetical protein SAMN03159340_02453 [Sphingomonas sp. NFR15]